MACRCFEVDPKGAGVTVDALPTFDHTLRLAKVVFDNAQGRALAAAGPVWAACARRSTSRWSRWPGSRRAARGGRSTSPSTTPRPASSSAAPSAASRRSSTWPPTFCWRASPPSPPRATPPQKLADRAPDAEEAIALAAFACADAFSKTTADAVQMHGGIAFTWAHPAHLYLRRARADAQLFGAPAVHRERYLVALGA